MRFNVVDSLRGYAIMSIILLHNVQHYSMYYVPENIPEWMQLWDGKISNIVYLLISGKSYEIFALLFGLTFFIMFNNQAKKGRDFRGRFLWRLSILFLFGLINSLFYHAEILVIYALFGVTMVIFSRWNNKVLLIIAIFLILQPIEWAKLIYLLNNHDHFASTELYTFYKDRIILAVTGNSFWGLIKGNIIDGKMATFVWAYESGRITQTIGLFILGLLLGRKGLFFPSDSNTRTWIRILAISLISILALHYLKLYLIKLIHKEIIIEYIGFIFSLWSNFVVMVIIVALFVILYQIKPVSVIMRIFEFVGRTSLTNYVASCIIGSIIYYGYGLGLYKYTGATYCLLIGISIFLLQTVFSRWWLKHHARGPLETIWHRLTWI